MASKDCRSATLELWLDQWRAGDAAAAQRLLTHAYDQLRGMARRMIRGFPAVRRWDDTDDVWQSAALRLHTALCQTTPESLTHFFRLAGTQIRRTLIELARKHNGPLGLAANHDTHDGDVATPDPTNDPLDLADWAEFHEQVERLPEAEREVFDLLWYGGLSQVEAAEHLGVTVRTVKRRWREARLLLWRYRSGYALG